MAFLFRYGIKDHAELFASITEIVKKLGQDYEVLYVGPNAHKIPDEFRYPGVRYLAIPFKVNRASSYDKFLKTLLWYLYLPFLSLYLRFWRADLIWNDDPIPLVGLIEETFSGRPVVMTVTDFFMEVYREQFPWLAPIAVAVRLLDRCAWKGAAFIVQRAESGKKYLSSQGVDPSKIYVIRDAFNVETFKPVRNLAVRKKYGFEEGDVVLCHHGILHPNKGIRRIMSWMIPLMKEDPKLKFLVIGDGPDLPGLKVMVEKEGLQKQVVFTGWLPASRGVADHLNASDIGLVMRIGQFSDHFHVTGTLVHCLMCGLPVLAARLGGISEIATDGVEGYLFDPDSQEQFCRALTKLKSNAALRGQMGEKGRARAVVEFDHHAVAEKTLHILRSFLDKDGTVRPGATSPMPGK
jgi:glycosyltransferase involved in cell wall biosynthesis